VFVDGHPVGGNPIKINFDDSGGQSVTEALLSLHQVTNKWMNDAGSQISRDDIAKGGNKSTAKIPSVYLTMNESHAIAHFS
jgi:hypothetical protein